MQAPLSEGQNWGWTKTVWTNPVKFFVNFFLDFRMVQDVQEEVDQRAGGGLHSGKEQVHHCVEDRELPQRAVEWWLGPGGILNT